MLIFRSYTNIVIPDEWYAFKLMCWHLIYRSGCRRITILMNLRSNICGRLFHINLLVWNVIGLYQYSGTKDKRRYYYVGMENIPVSICWYSGNVFGISILVSIAGSTVFKLLIVVSIWWYFCLASCINMLVSFKRLNVDILHQHTGIN